MGTERKETDDGDRIQNMTKDGYGSERNASGLDCFKEREQYSTFILAASDGADMIVTLSDHNMRPWKDSRGLEPVTDAHWLDNMGWNQIVTKVVVTLLHQTACKEDKLQEQGCLQSRAVMNM